MAEPSQPAPDDFATRWTLIRRLNGTDCDEESWAEFYHLYRLLIHAVACKAGLRHHEADDAVADTMRSVCDRIRDFKPDPAHGSFKSWLLQIARRRIVDQFRKRPPSAAAPAPDDGTTRTATIERVPDPASLDLDAMWENEWREKLLEVAVARVQKNSNPEQFQIFDLLVRRGMSVPEVMRALGVGRASVYLARHRVSKAVEKEAALLTRQVG